ncbi:hypothetical protein L1987_86347 [Smallanthus sonchifolius]|uniref:Uncharacterized protein n=1 Tax=Smallanthus sonchifolius TaxID=185202 RepID=A0ACB8XYC7_9ASTR|nr:hypothetical protein L1987_86347 [Smallanthus sonchifolius]
MVSSLLWLPKLRTFAVAPVAIQRTLAAATSHRHRHRYSSTASASGPAASRTISTLNSIRHEEYGRLLPCPSENVLPRNIVHLVVKEEGPILDFITKALDLPPL